MAESEDLLPLLLPAHDEGATPVLPCAVPRLIECSGDQARFAHDEFIASLANGHTRRAYAAAVYRLLDSPAVRTAGALTRITPSMVAQHIESLRCRRSGRPVSIPLRKRHLAAIRSFFDFAVRRHAVALNPAASVRGPRFSCDIGTTVPLPHHDVMDLLDHLDAACRTSACPAGGPSAGPAGGPSESPAGGMQHQRALALACRDRAIIAVLTFTAARVSAVAGLTRESFYDTGCSATLRFVEKHSRVRTIPCNRRLTAILRGYLAMAGATDRRGPMFPALSGGASSLPLAPRGILRVIRSRLIEAGLAEAGTRLGCHSFRAGAATHLLQSGIELSAVQDLLGHRDPRVTRRYDHRARIVAQDTVERLAG